MAVTKQPAGAPAKGGKKKAFAFVIDCSKPVEDKIMEIGAFEKFLVDKIKVDNKPGARAAFACWSRCSGCASHLPVPSLLQRHGWLCRASVARTVSPCHGLQNTACPCRKPGGGHVLKRLGGCGGNIHGCCYSLFAGVLGEQVKVTKDKTRVTVTSEADMSKRCAPVSCLISGEDFGFCFRV